MPNPYRKEIARYWRIMAYLTIGTAIVFALAVWILQP